MLNANPLIKERGKITGKFSNLMKQPATTPCLSAYNPKNRSAAENGSN
jgi:hypothetical protein